MIIKFQFKNCAFVIAFILGILEFLAPTPVLSSYSSIDLVQFVNNKQDNRLVSLQSICNFNPEEIIKLKEHNLIKTTGKEQGEYIEVEVIPSSKFFNKKCNTKSNQKIKALINRKKFNDPLLNINQEIEKIDPSKSSIQLGKSVVLSKIPMGAIIPEATSMNEQKINSDPSVSNDYNFGYCDKNDAFLNEVKKQSTSFGPLMSQSSQPSKINKFTQVASLFNPSLGTPLNKLSQELESDPQIKTMIEILDKNTSRNYNRRKHTFYGNKRKEQWKYLCVPYIKEALKDSGLTPDYIGGVHATDLSEVLMNDYGWKDILSDPNFNSQINNFYDLPKNSLLIYDGGLEHAEFKVSDTEYVSDHISDTPRTRDFHSFRGDGRKLVKVLIPPSIYSKAMELNSGNNLAKN